VRILLDQNLSPKLVRQVSDLFPGLESIYDHGLTGAPDSVIFDWARQLSFTAIVSADRDFVRLVETHGPPPKIIRVEHCDFPSRVLEQIFRREAVRIQEFLDSDRPVLTVRL
jgi:predicted nuclease of predicted toxin-antitoxin system